MNKKADYAQIIAAFALPLVLVGVAGWFAWSDTWDRAESELSRTADSAAELADRVFSSAILAARLTNTVLSGVSDEELRQNELRYHQQVAGIMAELPGSNMISVSDREGVRTLMSGQFPAASISDADREWVKVLKASDPPDVYVGGLSISRVAGWPFFSISIPRSGSGNNILEDGYDGNITVSLDPHKIAHELRTTTHEDADVIALVREDGEILTSTKGNWDEVPRVPSTSPLLASIGQGETRGIYEGQSLGLREGLPVGRGILIAFKKVGDLPVYTTVSRTPATIGAPWRQTMAALLAVGIPTSLALGFLSVTSLRRRNALGKSEAELRAAFENASTGTALIDSKTNQILKVNKRLCEIAGRNDFELTSLKLDDLLEAHSGGTGQLPFEEGDAAVTLNRLQRTDGSTRWIELATAAVTSSRITEPSLVIATLHDITERRESQERQILLAREVDHRAKNVLAIVRAVVRMEREPGAKAYVERVEGRIRALGKAHELLAKEGWHGVHLKSLVDDELAAYQNGSLVSVDGSDVVISSSTVQPLSMILHELATNAVKYGALAQPTGKLLVSWRDHLQSGGMELVWEEELGPGVRVSTGPRGSGLTVIQGSVNQLGGQIAFDWRDIGLACRIILPPAAITKSARKAAVHINVPPAVEVNTVERNFSGTRVLLIEDEVLVAMDMHEMLEQICCEVIGPAYSLDEARRLAELEKGRIDVAVIDVNVRGASSIELARELERAGVGVLLLTGYSEIPEKDDKDSWTHLQKPVSETDFVLALAKIVAREPGGEVVAPAV